MNIGGTYEQTKQQQLRWLPAYIQLTFYHMMKIQNLFSHLKMSRAIKQKNDVNIGTRKTEFQEK